MSLVQTGPPTFRLSRRMTSTCSAAGGRRTDDHDEKRAMVADWRTGAAAGVAAFGDREIYGLAGAAGGGGCTVQ